VFAGLELVREERVAGLSFEQAVAKVRQKIVFTTHTPVPAGNESHDIGLLEHMGATLGMARNEIEQIGGSPFGMTVAGLRLGRRANAVAALHAETARAMWRDVQGAAPIIGITNGVHVPTWRDPRVRSATPADKPAKVRQAQLLRVHQQLKRELIEEIDRRTGAELDPDRLLIGFARRAATYKRANLILGDVERLEPLLASRRVQLVFSGKAHPADGPGRHTIALLVAAARRWPHSVAFLQNYDMELGALLTRGCDVWLNTPRRPLEACGTSGMKAAMNGVLNLSILDGWWPEVCRHGENGWQIGTDDEGHGMSVDDRDRRDRDDLYRVLFDEVIPRYYDDRAGWGAMMEAAVASSVWRLSADRMIEDYYRRLYAAVDGGEEAV
jgi:starch phosphorylase